MVLNLITSTTHGKIFIFSYFSFLLVNFIQMLSGFNFLIILIFLYLIIVLLGLIPFEPITSKIENTIIDVVFLGLIFLSSCFCYVEILKFKLKNLRNEFQNTLDVLMQFNAFLDAKIDLINSNELTSKSMLNTLVGFFIFAGVCLFLYYFFSGGGNDPKDPTSSNSKSISSSNSIDSVSSTHLETESFKVLNIDDTVNNIIGDSIVKQWISFEKENPLSENKEDVSFFTEQSEKVIRALSKIKSFDPNLDISVEHLDLLVKSLNDFKRVVFSLTFKLENFGSDKDYDSFVELESIAKNLVDLLESQSKDVPIVYENSPVLCSVALFYGLIYESGRILTLLETVFKNVSKNFKLYVESVPLANRNRYTYALERSAFSSDSFLKELKSFDTDLQPFLFFKSIDLNKSSILKFFRISEDYLDKHIVYFKKK
jgi:hypothetical protein